MTKVYRVQATDGRGPFRPGLSKHWCDAGDIKRPMPIQDAFGFFWLEELRTGWMYGCACLSIGDLAKWFSPTERIKLEGISYFPVVIEADEIVRNREGEQVIFGCKKPFSDIAIKLTWNNLPWGGFMNASEPTAELVKEAKR